MCACRARVMWAWVMWEWVMSEWCAPADQEWCEREWCESNVRLSKSDVSGSDVSDVRLNKIIILLKLYECQHHSHHQASPYQDLPRSTSSLKSQTNTITMNFCHKDLSTMIAPLPNLPPWGASHTHRAPRFAAQTSTLGSPGKKGTCEMLSTFVWFWQEVQTLG